MPVYEYLCRRCNRIYSFMAATTRDERRPTCPRCGNVDLEKQVSLFAFVRGGTNPLAAVPKAPEEIQGSAGTEAPEEIRGSSGTQAPERDRGLYFLWDMDESSPK
jgi:putative FmdB family regulatory protein